MTQQIHPYEQAALAQKYTRKKAEAYFKRYKTKWMKRIANYFEHRVAVKALRLAGNPTQVLDFPCGTGRFWQGLLKYQPDLQLIAADYNAPMIETGLNNRKDSLPSKAFAGSLFSIPLANDSVQSVFSMRYFHHIGHDTARKQLLDELHRVTRETVIFSVYVEQGLAAKRWHKKHQNRQDDTIYNEYMATAEQIEASCESSGFEIVGFVDLCKGFSLWRTYVLKKKRSDSVALVKPIELVCPVCKGELLTVESPAELICCKDQLAFPVENQLPVLVLEKAREVELGKLQPQAEKVS